MSSFFEELKRRNVIKATLAYVVTSWVLLQVLSIVLPAVEAPEWVFKTLMILLVACFPIWVFFSWVYEVTPEGLKKTKQVSKDDSITQTTNKRLNILILVGLVATIAISLFQPTSNNTLNVSDAIVEQDLSIAVLPFDDMSSDGDTQWFCDGVTEDILTHLSKLSGIRVISRTSVMQYKNHKKTIPEIAKELGVSHVLEGSVRKQNNNVLITAQLIQANDEHLWADNYNEKLDNVFKIQSDVSKKIVEQLKIKLTPEEVKSINKKATDNIEAYELYLKGRWYVGTKESFTKSIDLLKQAISLDPNFADAYVAIASINLQHSYSGLMNYKEGLTTAKQYIDKAFSIDPKNTEAFQASVSYYSTIQDYEKIKENAEKAIALNPNNVDSRMLYAGYFLSIPIPQYDKYLEQIRIAQKIDPFSSHTNSSLINALLNIRKVKEAEEHYNKMKFTINKNQHTYIERKFKVYKNKDKTIEFNFIKERYDKNKKNPYLNSNLANQYLRIYNDYQKSHEYYKKAYELAPKEYFLSNRYFYSLLYVKKFDEAEKLLNDSKFMKVFNGDRHKYIYFDYHYYKGEYEKALTYLEKHEKNSQYYLNKGAIHAYLGDTEIVRNVLDNYATTYLNKSMIFAIQKNRDSMYYYMNKLITPGSATGVNIYPEFDMFRKEPRFKEFLKYNFLPITE